jgi:AcrR family transcriptional regulator
MTRKIESFSKILAAELAQAPPAKKGERTKRRLLLAATQVLERTGFHDLRVSDITDLAKAADGSFWAYFKDKKEVTLQVLEEYLTRMPELIERLDKSAATPFEQIREANLGWILNVRANAGLMRCVFQMSDEDSEFSRMVHATNRSWYERVARSVVRNHSDAAIDPQAALFASWSLGGMSDEMIRRLIVYPDKSFVRFVRKNSIDDEALASCMAVIWFRVLYPGLPLPPHLTGMAYKLAAFN